MLFASAKSRALTSVSAFIAEEIILQISSLVIVSFGLNLPSAPLIKPASYAAAIKLELQSDVFTSVNVPYICA